MERDEPQQGHIADLGLFSRVEMKTECKVFNCSQQKGLLESTYRPRQSRDDIRRNETLRDDMRSVLIESFVIVLLWDMKTSEKTN